MGNVAETKGSKENFRNEMLILLNPVYCLNFETGYKALHDRYKVEADSCVGKT